MTYGNATHLVISRTVRIDGDLYVTGTVYEGDNANDDGFDTPGEVAANNVNGPSFNDGEEIAIGGEVGQPDSLSPLDSSSEDNLITDGDFINGDNPTSGDVEKYSGGDSEYREIDYDDEDIGDDDSDIPDDGPDDGGGDSNDPDEWDPYKGKEGDLFTGRKPAPMNSEEYFALDGKINDLDFKYETLSGIVMETQERLREGFAMSAAIAARPTPKDYGFHFTAGAGNYDSVNAVSMGFIYAQEDFTISVGHAKSDTGGPTMTNIGISYNISSLFKKKK
jgi:hypothetical protein